MACYFRKSSRNFHGRRPCFRSPSGFTLLELLVSITIVAVLVTVAAASYARVRAEAKRVKCVSHMRAIHSGFLSAVEDQGHWPVPDDKVFGSEQGFAKFWIKALEPYGISEETWWCPADSQALDIENLRESGLSYISYVPTVFDDKPQSPFRYNQPWLIERGSFHRGGGQILMPDGSVTGKRTAFFGR
ncbi:MAG: prepilin-type N-terminal cleavage/methylation domain-containing protein [Verrucomicrobiota bacterium]